MPDPPILKQLANHFQCRLADSLLSAYDIIVQAMGGIMSVTGQPGSIPTRVGSSIGDIAVALYATIGVLAALRVKEETGQGQEIDVAMLDCQVAILESAIARYAITRQLPGLLGNRHPSITPFASVRTSAGYIVVAAGDDALFEKLCCLLGAPELARDPRFTTNKDRTDHWPELGALLGDRFSARPSAQWLELLTEKGLPCGPINNLADVVSDPQIRERGMIKEIEIEGHALSFSGNPLKFSLTPAEENYLPAPELGEHNQAILG